MRIRVLIVLLALAPAAFAQDAPRGELGARWWISSGETKISHNSQGLDPILGNPTSVLVYQSLDANVVELFGRQNFHSRWFLKGYIGYGRLNSGGLDDEDFFVGQVKFSDTISSLPQGRVGYGALDLGYHWLLGGGAVSLGVFAGFTQWTETYHAYGLSDLLGFTGNVSREVNVISDKVRWRALRLGVAGDLRIGRARLALDFAALPYAQMRNEDSHHLRSDLGPVPNIVDEGDGWGVQLDAELRYEIMRRTELGIGARFWYVEVRDGTTDFRHLAGGEAPLVDFYTWRSGVTLSLRRVW